MDNTANENKGEKQPLPIAGGQTPAKPQAPHAPERAHEGAHGHEGQHDAQHAPAKPQATPEHAHDAHRVDAPHAPAQAGGVPNNAHPRQHEGAPAQAGGVPNTAHPRQHEGAPAQAGGVPNNVHSGHQEGRQPGMRAPMQLREPNTILVGKKSVMAYVLAVVSQFNNGSPFVKIKARGKIISRAVDVAEIVRHRFINSAQAKEIKISTEDLQSEDGTMAKVSSIEIVLVK